MASASSSTSCLRVSKRDTAIDIVNPSKSARIPSMAASTVKICDLMLSGVRVSTYVPAGSLPRWRPASARKRPN